MNKKLRIGVMGLIRGEFVLRVARLMPDDVIMAAGAFVSGSSIELSADGPIKPPYTVYFPIAIYY